MYVLGVRYVKSLETATKFELKVDSADETILDIKEKILDQKGIPIAKQKLFHCEKELENGIALNDSLIREKTTIYLQGNFSLNLKAVMSVI